VNTGRSKRDRSTESDGLKLPEQKLTTRQQIELELAEKERKHALAVRELERAKEKLAIAIDERKSLVNTTIDVYKLSFEAMKHLTTLSVGSILLMVTFLEKLFNPNREWTGLIGFSLICFVASIVSAMASMTQWPTVLGSMVTAKKSDKEGVMAQALRQVKGERIAFLTFIVGIVSLIIFAFKNLY
jgi:hypothetical protein